MDPAKLFGKASKEATFNAAAQAEFSEKKWVLFASLLCCFMSLREIIR